MASFSTENIYPECIIKDNIDANGETLGCTIGINKIILDKEVIESLMQGHKLNLICIFHELTHIQQNIQIHQGRTTETILKIIKDNILDDYQRGTIIKNMKTDNLISYYDINYAIESSEIDAKLNSILLTKKFFIDNGIDYTMEEKELDARYEEALKQKNRKRNLSMISTFNSYFLSLDDAFDVIVENHPQWLLKYPQLNQEY